MSSHVNSYFGLWGLLEEVIEGASRKVYVTFAPSQLRICFPATRDYWKLESTHVTFWERTYLYFAHDLRLCVRLILKTDGPINEMEEILGCHSIQVLAWLLIAALSHISNKNQEAAEQDFYNLQFVKNRTQLKMATKKGMIDEDISIMEGN